MEGHDSVISDDPRQNTTDMTAFVQNLLEQMQTRFQAMSESIITKNILLLITHALFSLLSIIFFRFMQC
ncbi:unnamed protein product [Amaranthus hypochondriacus]